VVVDSGDMMQSHREMTDRMISEYSYVQEATQQMFEERFRARGIEDPEFIQQLKGLAMRQTLSSSLSSVQ
jgi:hypothetical protein